MIEQQVPRAGIRISVQSLGVQSAPPLLLLAGNGCSSVYWPDRFCAPLVDAGFRVLRFDYRDTGDSTHRAFDENPYDLDDLAQDVLCILEAFDVPRVHLVGLSMGGFLAQRLAIDCPERVLTLTSLLSTSDYAAMLHPFSGGEPPTSNLPPPSARWLAELAQLPGDLSHTDLLVESWRLASGSKADFDPIYWRQLLGDAARRGDDSLAGDAHRSACLRSARLNLLSELPKLSVPSLFIGGSEDPIFPPGHAEASATATPGGRALQVEGLGHALEPSFFSELANAIVQNARASREDSFGPA